MRKMLMGIFLLILSIWCLIFGVIDQVFLFSLAGVSLPIFAVIVFLLGFFDKEDKA